jgi:L-seryl-tRNA(Ser) seleniumtransferase
MSLRDLPSVDKLLTQAGGLIADYGRPLTTEIFREVLDEARANFRPSPRGSRGDDGQEVIPSATEILSQVRARLAALSAPSLRPVINASGVILHTNLGRAPLSRSALAQMDAAARSYSTL